MDIGTVDESQPVDARCCVQIRGVLCGRPAEHEATEDILKAAAAFKRSPRNGKLTWDASLSLIVKKKRWVCGEHAFDLCQPSRATRTLWTSSTSPATARRRN